MRFPVILCDPAWTYRDKAAAGNRGAAFKYKLMTAAEMATDLPVEDIAAPDCALFMWATYPMLGEALALGAAWGFTYKTVAFTWVKANRPFYDLIEYLRDGWSPFELAALRRARKTDWFIGMGRWTRSNAEVCLLFTKGKPHRVDAGVNQIICAPALRHSAKPPETRVRILRLLGALPAVELFARERCPGWTSLGYDIDGRDLRVSIPALAAQRTPAVPRGAQP